MIRILARPNDAALAEIVVKAFERSFTRSQVRGVDDAHRLRSGILVVIRPAESDIEGLDAFLRTPGKLVLLGPLGPSLARLAGVAPKRLPDSFAAHALCAPAPTHGGAESAALIRYDDHGLGACVPLRTRPFCRFDFTDEWNNLGYGRIGVGDEPWSIAQAADLVDAGAVAQAMTADGQRIGAVATLRDTAAASVLWFARPAGPIDGPDWRIVEAFVSDHRHGALPCRPHLKDIPHGIAAAVTMRLDCDEAIASARPLFALYRARGLPLSVAVKTGQPIDADDLALLADIRQSGGSILSHSVSHAPNWGGSAQAAEAEARESRAALMHTLPGLAVRYAVSPFHQNPRYVPGALARAGLSGMIAGTIANDPEYLMARGGEVPFGPRGFVSHSQSCMLHGDCLRADGDPLAIYKQAFGMARAESRFFGFLDHPFSPRYAYGWSSEAARLAAHAELLDVMTTVGEQAGKPLLFASEDTCLDFMREKAAVEIAFEEARDSFSISRTQAAGLPLAVGFGGSVQAAHSR